MVTPDIDWWIKNVTQVKNPVYSRKRYAISSGNTVKTKVNQNNNIVLILLTDILLSASATGTGNVLDNSTNVKVFETRIIKDTPLYISNFYYLIQSEDINFSINTFTTANIGYITISSKT